MFEILNAFFVIINEIKYISKKRDAHEEDCSYWIKQCTAVFYIRISKNVFEILNAFFVIINEIKYISKKRDAHEEDCSYWIKQC